MFRCKECGTEFDVKPDYCDCGNDTFDEIVEQVEIQKEEPVFKQPEIKNPFTFEQKIEKEEIVKVSPKKENKKEPLIVFEKPDLPQIKIEPISLMIFLICLILSFVVVFFVGNPKDEVKSTEKAQTQVINNNIPNIDKFWDNTAPKVTVEESSVQKDNEDEVIEEPIVQNESIKKENNIQKLEKKQPQKNQMKKNNAVTLPMPSGQKPVNVGTTKQQSKPVSKPQQTASQKAKTQPKTQPKTTQTTQKSNPQELSYYKIALRNKLASRIDFTNVLGDGTCVITFKVSSSGQLTNRAFAKQSDNGMLNDEVYQAVMSTPTFKAPPSAYKGETMRLTVKMYGGNFEVSLN